METPISKSQLRAMRLAGLVAVETYEAAAVALQNAGYRKDGIPMASSWRAAAKMSDIDLVVAITLDPKRFEDQEKVEY